MDILAGIAVEASLSEQTERHFGIAVQASLSTQT